MLKIVITLCVLIFLSFPVFSRTNAEIGLELYSVANIVKKNNVYKSDVMKDNIASFLMDANMIGFDENNAQWKKLSTSFYYDANSIKHYNLRHLGVYMSIDGLTMGIFDVNCEDINDVQGRYFGYVQTTEVYFSPTFKPKNGHNKGLMKMFCK